MLNRIGNHPLQVRVDPPTAVTFFRHGISLRGSMPSFDRCTGPARHIPAPLSGNIIICFVRVFLLEFGRMGVILAAISWMLLMADAVVYESVSS